MSNDNSKALSVEDFFAQATELNQKLQEEAERRLAEERAQEAAESGGLPFARVVQPGSSMLEEYKDEGAISGGWMINLGNDERIFTRWFTGLIIDRLGTKGGHAESNPTIWQWSVPMDEKDDREKYGMHYVRFTDGVHADPGYYGRTLRDPRFIHSSPIEVGSNYKNTSSKMADRDVEITEATTVRNCQLYDWYRPWEDGKPMLGDSGKVYMRSEVLEPIVKVVVLPVYVQGYGHWDRGPVQIELRGTAARVLWDDNDNYNKNIREKLGMEPLEYVLKPGGIPQGTFGTDVQFFGSVVFGSKMFKNEKYDKYIAVPQALNLADEMDGAETPSSALAQVVSTLTQWYGIKAKQRERFETAAKELIMNSLVISGTVNPIAPAFASFQQIKDEYETIDEERGIMAGRAAITVPWSGTDDSEEDSEEASNDTAAELAAAQQKQGTATVIEEEDDDPDVMPEIEDFQANLDALMDDDDNFVGAEDEDEADEDEEELDDDGW